MNKDYSIDNKIKNWEDVQNHINEYLIQILRKIEWRYGNGRAPFKFPPNYRWIEKDKGLSEYICDLVLDFGEDEKLNYHSHSPNELYEVIKHDIDERFAPK